MIGPPSRSCGHSRVSLGTPLSLLDMCVTSAGAAGYCLALRSRWIWSLSAVGGGSCFYHSYFLDAVLYTSVCVCVNAVFVFVSLEFFSGYLNRFLFVIQD